MINVSWQDRQAYAALRARRHMLRVMAQAVYEVQRPTAAERIYPHSRMLQNSAHAYLVIGPLFVSHAGAIADTP